MATRTAIEAPTTPRPARRIPRRTQAERRAGTRRKLLGAAISCLIEHGYARTTTPAVCRAAGVSQGALFLHFPSKHELLCAAAEHLFDGLIRDYRRAFAAIPADADRVEAAVEVLASLFEQPELQAAFELYLAARTDPELRARLGPVVERHADNLRAEARALFPVEAAGVAQFDAVVDLAVSALQGAALGGEAFRDAERNRQRIRQIVHVVRQTLAESEGESS